MSFTPVNFVNGVTSIEAAWANGVDQMVYNILGGWQGQTLAIVQAALTLPSPTSPLPITAGGTGETTEATALTALGGVTAAQVAASLAADYAAGELSPFPQSAKEAAQGVTPPNLNYPYGNVLRYGADGSGVTDSTTAFLNCLLCNGFCYAPAGTYNLSTTTLTLGTGQTL